MRHVGWKIDFSVALACVFAVLAVGCGGEAEKDTSDDKKQARLAKTETTSVTPSSPTIETSPAKRKSDLPPRDAAPDVVCRAFLDLLRSDKRLAAENLLTRSALAVTGRADLRLEPLGSDAAKYELGQPQYATNKQVLAQVVCKITDEIDGEKFESDLTWMVRKQNEGWRISGIMIQLEADQPQDLLSFENYDDVLKIKSSLSDEPVEYQAALPSENSSRK